MIDDRLSRIKDIFCNIQRRKQPVSVQEPRHCFSHKRAKNDKDFEFLLLAGPSVVFKSTAIKDNLGGGAPDCLQMQDNAAEWLF